MISREREGGGEIDAEESTAPIENRLRRRMRWRENLLEKGESVNIEEWKGRVERM